jgi:hypothetical protein
MPLISPNILLRPINTLKRVCDVRLTRPSLASKERVCRQMRTWPCVRVSGDAVPSKETRI